MKGPLVFLALLGVIVLGLGLWLATPQGGGGIGEEGPAGGAGGVATPASVNDDAQDNSEGSVEMTENGFEPRTVQVVGQGQVTFINRDDVERSVDFEDDGIRDARRIPPGEAHVVEMPGKGRFPFDDPTAEGARGTVVASGG